MCWTRGDKNSKIQKSALPFIYRAIKATATYSSTYYLYSSLAYLYYLPRLSLLYFPIGTILPSKLNPGGGGARDDVTDAADTPAAVCVLAAFTVLTTVNPDFTFALGLTSRFISRSAACTDDGFTTFAAFFTAGLVGEAGGLPIDKDATFDDNAEPDTDACVPPLPLPPGPLPDR